jgi:hypothetical protein
MSKKIAYQKTVSMEPRPGVKYATTYYKQTLAQRKELVKHIISVIEQIGEATRGNEEYLTWFEQPQKMYPKTQAGRKKEYRSIMEMFDDIIGECRGAKRDGTPKDFAQAPIDRWNKLFYDTEWAIDMVESESTRPNTFDDLMVVKK